MFDAFKGMAGVAGLMKDMPRIKARMEEVREELAEMTVEAMAGGGAVIAVADGKMRIRSIKVDPTMLAAITDGNAHADQSIAETLMMEAVNAALAKAQKLIGERLAAAAEEFDLPLPASGLAGLLGG